MAPRIQYRELRLDPGWVETTSAVGAMAGIRSPTEAWRLPGHQDIVSVFGPYKSKETDTTGAVPKIASGIVGKDSSGNVLRVVHDITAGQVKVLNANGTLGSQVTSSPSVSTTTPVAFVVYNEKILCFDGETQPFQILISSGVASTIGVTQPIVTNATTSDLDTAGNVKGTVKYYIAQMSGTTEGALSVAFGTIDASLNQGGQGTQISIDLTHGNFGSNTYRLYRTMADREAPNYLAVVIGGNTYTDNIPDEDLGDLPRLHGDQPPVGITAAAVYNDTIYGLAGNDLYFSDPGEEQSWWTAADGNIISMDKGDGDVGVALFVDFDGLVIFKENHIYKLLGTSPEDFQVVPVVTADANSPTVGTPKINTVAGIPGGAVFYHDQGFFIYSAGQVRRLSASISAYMHESAEIDVSTSGALAYDPRFGLVYCAARIVGAATASGMLVLDTNTGSWLGNGASEDRLITSFLYDAEQSSMFAFSHFDFTQDEYECFTIADVASGKNKADLATITTAAIKGDLSRFELPPVFGPSLFTEKRVLWLEVEADAATTDGTLTLQLDINDDGFASSETDTYVAGRVKYRFNLGKYGWVRSMRPRLSFTHHMHVHSPILVAYQEQPSQSL